MISEQTLFDPDSTPTPAQLKRMFRKNNPETSKQAAKKVLAKVGTQKYVVLQAFKERYPEGFTDEELIDYCDLRLDNARKRRVDLYNDGLVEKTSRTRTTTSGCEAIVWRLAK
jgi:hypothetical protein